MRLAGSLGPGRRRQLHSQPRGRFNGMLPRIRELVSGLRRVFLLRAMPDQKTG